MTHKAAAAHQPTLWNLPRARRISYPSCAREITAEKDDQLAWTHRVADRVGFIRSNRDELGYENGQNLRLIYRSAEGQPQLLSGLASELVGMKPDVLVTGLGTVAARAGKTVSGGVPVVFMAVVNPVGANIVESLARPGGNVTGLSDLAAHIQGRRLALLREFAPAATIVAVVLNPGTPYTALAYKELEQAAKIVNIELRAFEVRSPEEITPQLEAIKVGGAGALAILEDPLTH